MNLMQKHKILMAGILTCAFSGMGFGLFFDRSFVLSRFYWRQYERHGYVVSEHEYQIVMAVIVLLALASANAVTKLAFRLVEAPLPHVAKKKLRMTFLVPATTLVLGGLWCLISSASFEYIVRYPEYRTIGSVFLNAIGPVLLLISFLGYRLWANQPPEVTG